MGRCSSCKSKQVERLIKNVEYINGSAPYGSVVEELPTKKKWYDPIILFLSKLLLMSVAIPVSLIGGIIYLVVLLFCSLFNVSVKLPWINYSKK